MIWIQCGIICIGICTLDDYITTSLIKGRIARCKEYKLLVSNKEIYVKFRSICKRGQKLILQSAIPNPIIQFLTITYINDSYNHYDWS